MFGVPKVVACPVPVPSVLHEAILIGGVQCEDSAVWLRFKEFIGSRNRHGVQSQASVVAFHGDGVSGTGIEVDAFQAGDFIVVELPTEISRHQGYGIVGRIYTDDDVLGSSGGETKLKNSHATGTAVDVWHTPCARS